MIVAGIDPGPEESALVLWDGSRVIEPLYLKNAFMLSQLKIKGGRWTVLAIEKIASFRNAGRSGSLRNNLLVGPLCRSLRRRARRAHHADRRQDAPLPFAAGEGWQRKASADRSVWKARDEEITRPDCPCLMSL